MPRPNVFDLIQPVTRGRPPRRPAAPKGLSEAAGKHWRRIVEAKPAGYFDAPGQVLLERLCEHAAQAEWMSAAIHALDPEDAKEFVKLARLLRMEARETAAIVQLSEKLRLLPPLKAPRPKPIGVVA